MFKYGEPVVYQKIQKLIDVICKTENMRELLRNCTGKCNIKLSHSKKID